MGEQSQQQSQEQAQQQSQQQHQHCGISPPVSVACLQVSDSKRKVGSPSDGSAQRTLTSSAHPHSMKVGHGSTKNIFPSSSHSHSMKVAPGRSNTVVARSMASPVGSLAASPCASIGGRKGGLMEGEKGPVRHPVGKSLHLSHVPWDRAAIAEREDSVPVPVFLDSQLTQVSPNETLSEGLSTVNLRSSPSNTGNSNLKRRCVSPHALISPAPSRNCGPGALMPGARLFPRSGTVQPLPTRQ